ncbi:MAG: DsbA family oxidoreductase [Cognatishimia sp.]|uniref:DsbA family oxidoreductase n=1 Tax=Cognatishimia sp. 1_MG-2023 TaxID=3062642 RepID=UPI0026E208A7|nr:DsbA family oxidoreductase [Cognatishimia sp. 1_MG-2023]MDO6725849.1 DsbA family oxidoreductase [Cognatishimia sp. 1_MG-2023]
MALRIDIVSDVVCPWCAVGYKQLEQALKETGHEVEIYWHPFELNPQMEPAGEELRDHLARKYGSTKEQSDEARARLTEAGDALGFTFAFNEDSRIFNTFQAHQLLHWAGETGKAHDLKLALLKAYFTDGKDVSDVDVLVAEASAVGLDANEARAVLADGRFAEIVRTQEGFWTSRGISGVPSMIFDNKHLVTGAQGTENYVKILNHVISAPAEAS